MNVRNHVLVGQRRCTSHTEAIAAISEWLAEGGDCRVFLNRVGEQIHVELWRPER